MLRSGRLAACLLALAATAPLAAQSTPPLQGTVLARPVSFAARNVTLGDALTRLRHEANLPLAWSADLLPDRKVSVNFTGESLALALGVLLSGSGLDVAVARDGTVVIVPAAPADAVATGTPAPGYEWMDVERVRLATGVRQLDQIVVTGSAVTGAPEWHQPTAMNVVGAERLEDSPYSRVSDVMRTLLPGVVLWDRGPSGPPPQVTSVRGVSSFSTRALKTYVDGVELASPDLFTLLDGRSIERIEVIRGPQGAALYGPDAINGILQIVTRKGTPGAERADLRATAAAGPYDRPDLAASNLYQDYSAAVTGGSRAVGMDVGGSFIQSGRSGGIPWLQTWTAQAGTRALLGPVVFEASGRTAKYEYTDELATSQANTAAPVVHQLEETGFGLTALHAVSARWRQTLVVGQHQVSGPREANRPALLTPRLPLGATHEDASRSSVRYSSAVDLPVGAQEVMLSAGAEYSHRDVERLVRRPSVAARDLSPLYRDEVTSRGAFGQLRGRFADRLVLNVGTRAEWNTSVGENEGAQWASSAGLSWTQLLGTSTLRLRAAWGRGLKPPEPGMSRAMSVSTIVQLPNPDLSSETQSGWELGAELFLRNGLFARATWYDQTAEDLIQQVQIKVEGATRSFQWQNLGEIANTGVELEAGAAVGALTLSGVLYLTSSQVTKLTPRYTGDLKPGDDLLEVPSSVGSLAVRYDGGFWNAEVGGSWLGPWMGYDWAGIQSVVDGVAPARGPVRNYWLEYPGVFRPYLAGTVQVGRRLSAFARMENPGNTGAYIRDNISPPLGRTAIIGLELLP